MDSFFDKIGGRKFALALVVLVFGTLVQLFGKNGLSTEYVSLLIGITGIFGVANAAVSMKHADAPTAAPAGASTGDEANVKADQLATELEQYRAIQFDSVSELNDVRGVVDQLRSELETQAKSLALATQLIKASMKVNV